MSNQEHRLIQHLKNEYKKMNKDQLIEIILNQIRPHINRKPSNGR